MENITTINEQYMHDLGDIYDAEHQFIKGMEDMVKNAGDAKLKQMINTHIEQTKGQIKNLEQVFNILGKDPERVMCDAAKGLVSEAGKGMKEASEASAVQDVVIAGAADKVEHYEIASYRALIKGAQLMGQNEVVNLLQQNLDQEENTSALLEQSLPSLLKTALSAEGLQVNTSL